MPTPASILVTKSEFLQTRWILNPNDCIKTSSAPSRPSCNTPYSFQREGGVKDIAGISIHNNDAGGIGLDEFKHDVPATVPEPSTLVPLGVGAMAGATRGWVRRKRRP
jgi:hypothetical protein